MSITTAQDKLKKALDKAKNKDFAKPVIEYLLGRVAASEALANDVDQEHKTWDKCEKYIMDKAKAKLGGKNGALQKETVFEWAEDYFHLDDKAQAEKEAKEKAERDAKAKKEIEERRKKAVAKPEISATVSEAKKPEPKKEKGSIDGQMDLMSLFGM